MFKPKNLLNILKTNSLILLELNVNV